MSTPRVFAAPRALIDGIIEIAGDDHHYLFDVLRLAVGDAVIAVDGTGHEADSVVSFVGAMHATLTVRNRRHAIQPTAVRVTCILSLIKGNRTEWAIQKLVELGVHRIIPVQAERSVVKLTAARQAARYNRYIAVAANAARQCRRATTADIFPIADLTQALTTVACSPHKLILRASGEATPMRDALPQLRGDIAILVGPEGGWADTEVQSAIDAGFAPTRLGTYVLRAETAAIAAIAVIGLAAGDM